MKQLLLALAIFNASATFVGAETTEEIYSSVLEKSIGSAGELVQEALKLQKDSKYAEAAIVYKKILLKNNKDFLSWNNLGICEQKRKIYDRAEQCFNRAIELEPMDSQAYNNLASLKIELGEFDEAEGIYKEAIQKDPEQPLNYNNLASLYKLKGKLFQATQAYKQAIQRAPLPEFYYNLGLVYFDMQKFDDMVETFDEALKLKPDYPEVYYSLSLAHLHNLLALNPQKRKKELEFALKKLNELDPKAAQKFKETYLTTKKTS
jgi:tetratricopeptide (TPR) repeat protein